MGVNNLPRVVMQLHPADYAVYQLGHILVFIVHFVLCDKNQAPDLQNITIILGVTYDNAKVTINLRRPYNLPNILRRTQGFS